MSQLGAPFSLESLEIPLNIDELEKLHGLASILGLQLQTLCLAERVEFAINSRNDKRSWLVLADNFINGNMNAELLEARQQLSTLQSMLGQITAALGVASSSSNGNRSVRLWTSQPVPRPMASLMAAHCAQWVFHQQASVTNLQSAVDDAKQVINIVKADASEYHDQVTTKPRQRASGQTVVHVLGPVPEALVRHLNTSMKTTPQSSSTHANSANPSVTRAHKQGSMHAGDSAKEDCTALILNSGHVAERIEDKISPAASSRSIRSSTAPSTPVKGAAISPFSPVTVPLHTSQGPYSGKTPCPTCTIRWRDAASIRLPVPAPVPEILCPECILTQEECTGTSLPDYGACNGNLAVDVLPLPRAVRSVRTFYCASHEVFEEMMPTVRNGDMLMFAPGRYRMVEGLLDLRCSVTLVGLGATPADVVLYNDDEDDCFVESWGENVRFENLTLLQRGGYEGILVVSGGCCTVSACQLSCSMSGAWVKEGGRLVMNGCKVTGAPTCGVQVDAGACCEMHDTEISGCGFGDTIVPPNHGGIQLNVRLASFPAATALSFSKLLERWMIEQHAETVRAEETRSDGLKDLDSLRSRLGTLAPPAKLVLGFGCKVVSNKGYGLSVIKPRALWQAHEALQPGGQGLAALEGCLVYVAAGVTLSGNSRGPLGVVDKEFTELGAAEVTQRALAKFFHSITASGLSSGFASPCITHTSIPKQLERSYAAASRQYSSLLSGELTCSENGADAHGRRCATEEVDEEALVGIADEQNWDDEVPEDCCSTGVDELDSNGRREQSAAVSAPSTSKRAGDAANSEDQHAPHEPSSASPRHDRNTGCPRPVRRSRCCWYCGAMSPDLKICGACSKARYCDAMCQREHWNEHRSQCHAWRRVTVQPNQNDMQSEELTDL